MNTEIQPKPSTIMASKVVQAHHRSSNTWATNTLGSSLSAKSIFRLEKNIESSLEQGVQSAFDADHLQLAQLRHLTCD